MWGQVQRNKVQQINGLFLLLWFLFNELNFFTSFLLNKPRENHLFLSFRFLGINPTIIDVQFRLLLVFLYLILYLKEFFHKLLVKN